MSSTSRFRCPHCKNTNPKTLLDNGEETDSRDLTMLCVARVAPEDWSFDSKPTQEDIATDGTVPCGMQWDPNQ